MVAVLAAVTARAQLVLTNYAAANPLKMLESGDSITDDSVVNGAWRVYLQQLLVTNGYAFTNLGRWASTPFTGFTQVHHEGMDGAVIAAPGVSGPTHSYSLTSNYAQLTVADALTNASPDVVLIDLGVNDIGHARNPYQTATNDLSGLLDMIFTRLPAACVIVSKPTTITYSTILTPPYYTYRTNMFIFCDAVQAMAAVRRARGQNVFVADLFSSVNGATMLNSDGTHPNTTGLQAIAAEMMFRIAAITTRPDSVLSPFILGGSVWKYSDQGLDLGTNWSQPGFDDSTWSQGAGRLGYNVIGVTTTAGYGTNIANTYITTYFRHQFVVPGGICYTNLNVRLNRKDGAVVWLNGTELFRMNLPTGTITNQTTASTSVSTLDPSNTYYPTNVPVTALPPGTNLIAVEIHKYSAKTGGISFDLELFGNGVYQPPPTLSYAYSSANLQLVWPTNFYTSFVLQAAPGLSFTSTWQIVPGPYPRNNNSFDVSFPINASSAQFFRLIKPGP